MVHRYRRLGMCQVMSRTLGLCRPEYKVLMASQCLSQIKPSPARFYIVPQKSKIVHMHLSLISKSLESCQGYLEHLQLSLQNTSLNIGFLSFPGAYLHTPPTHEAQLLSHNCLPIIAREATH